MLAQLSTGSTGVVPAMFPAVSSAFLGASASTRWSSRGAVPEDASDLDRLLDFAGRDPQWVPGRTAAQS